MGIRVENILYNICTRDPWRTQQESTHRLRRTCDVKSEKISPIFILTVSFNLTYFYNIFSSIYSYIDTRILRRLQLDHIHKVPVILYDKLQRQSHTSHSLPISVTWLLLLLNQTNTGTSTALTAETHWSMSTRFRATSRLVTSS